MIAVLLHQAPLTCQNCAAKFQICCVLQVSISGNEHAATVQVALRHQEQKKKSRLTRTPSVDFLHMRKKSSRVNHSDPLRNTSQSPLKWLTAAQPGSSGLVNLDVDDAGGRRVLAPALSS